MYDAQWGDEVSGPAVLGAVRMDLLGMWQSPVYSHNAVLWNSLKAGNKVFSFAWERRKQNMNFLPLMLVLLVYFFGFPTDVQK